ncbi:uncharacterized protein M6G45_000935 [Spheniscus humboldti]
MDGHCFLLLLGALPAAALPQIREYEESKTLNQRECALLERQAFSWCLGRATERRRNQAIFTVLGVSVNATEPTQSPNWCVISNTGINAIAEQSPTQSHQKSKGFTGDHKSCWECTEDERESNTYSSSQLEMRVH